MHWLIVIPYYFVAPLATLPFLILVCRLMRAKLSINTLVGGAIAFSVLAVIAPLVCGWLDLSAFTGRSLLLIVLASFLFAAIDALLKEWLPLPLDKELHDL